MTVMRVFARYLGLACLVFVLVGTGRGDARADGMAAYQRLNDGLIAGHVVPRYEALVAATAALEESAAGFCDAPDPAALAGLREAFHGAMDAWMGIQHIRFGPVELFLRYDRYAFWPDKRNAIGRQLDALLAAADPAALEPRAFGRGSVAPQGFTALERLLFAADAEAKLVEAAADQAYRCALVGTIAANLARMSAETLSEWREGERPFADVIATAGEDNTHYRDAREATLDFFKALHGPLQQVADLKLSRPLGSALDKAKPRRAESWRSARSLENVRANLAAVESLYAGEAGFTRYVVAEAKDETLDRELRERLAALRAIADDVQGPLIEAVADPNERPKLERLLNEVQDTRQLVETRLSAALGVQVGFNAFDGD